MEGFIRFLNRSQASAFISYNDDNRKLDDFFAQLFLRYLYLLVIEVISDLCIRFYFLKKKDLNVSNIGRNATVYNYKTRFLFTVFLVYYLADIYYAIISTTSFTS